MNKKLFGIFYNLDYSIIKKKIYGVIFIVNVEL